MQKAILDYGDGYMPIEVPDSARILRFGKDFIDPPALEDPVAAVKAALENPMGSKRIGELVKPGDKVAICFPDRVKGGTHEHAHRKITIPLILNELNEAGIPDENIKLICAIGLHKKNLRSEMAQYLGEDIVNRFGRLRLVNHDCEDPDGMVFCGEDEFGDYVDMNRDAFEADLTILLGHAMGNPYGGYSGGYKMAATGLTSWRSIRYHHTPASMYRDDFVPVNPESRMRHQFRAINKTMEAKMGRKFFAVDAVLDTNARILGVYAGVLDEVEKASQKLAQKRTEVFLPAEEKFDILVVGLPRNFHYGPGMGSNPILMLQAIGATLSRCYDVMRKDCVVIAASICDGWFNDEWFPAYREVYQLLQRCNKPEEMVRYEDQMAHKPEYIYAYRYAYGYHPFHAFSMVYMGGVALKNSQAVYIIGAKEPGLARGMGCKTAATFEDAVKDAEKLVGKDPKMLVLPEFLSKAPVHLRAQR